MRVTALLECFEWTLNKPPNKTVGMTSTMLSMPSGWGSTFGAISFYYDSIIIGRVSLAFDHYWYRKEGTVIVLIVIIAFKSND